MDMLAMAWTAQQAGQFLEADRICRQILEADPENAEAWRLLGLANFRLNRLGEAESSYRSALSVRPDLASVHSDLGVALAMQGRLDEAVPCLRQALAQAPNLADAHNNLGMALSQLGRLDEAEASLRQAVQLNHPTALSTLGHILSSQRKYRAIADLFGPIARATPGHLEAHLRLGEALTRLGEFDEAMTCLQTATRLAPSSPDAHNGLGIALAGLKRVDEAIACFRTALQLKPNQPDVYNNLANSLRTLGRYDESLVAADKALQLQPDHADAHNNRGFALDELGRYEEAIASYEQALRVAPSHAEAQNNRGVALGKLGRYEEAIASYGLALRVNPDYAEAQNNRAMAWLILGDYAQGWPEFEWRWKCQGYSMPVSPRPLWRGEPLAGRTIFLHPEQGLGDTLELIRFAPLLKARGGRVVVQCQKPLVRLLETCPGIDQIVPKGEAVPDFDVHLPLMSLPGLLKTTLETIPASIPYLFADPALVARWRTRLSAWPGFQVGIVWQGNPKYAADRRRSYPLAAFEPLARIEGVRLISLQKDFGAEQVRDLEDRFPVVDLGDFDQGEAAFLDTAAIMRNLDLIITADTATAHLAGALGVPVWVALAFTTDWRWLVGRTDSPWYPSARLFRQTERGRWGPVFDRMADALKISSRPAAESPPPG